MVLDNIAVLNLNEVNIDVNDNAIVRIDSLELELEDNVEIEYDIMIKKIVKQLI